VYPGAPEPTKFGELDAGYVAVVLFPRQGRAPRIQREKVGSWQWRDERVTSLAELEQLRAQDLKHCVLRLTLEIETGLAELEKIEKILVELEGTEATHGRAGIVQIHRRELRLDPRDVTELALALPDVLKSVAQRLQQRAASPDGALERQALYHLCQSVRRLKSGSGLVRKVGGG
jgi:DNA repair exonuclease SbcCD nuclease subunit